MLTIEIPESNRKRSEEDELARFILDGIRRDGKREYFHFGVGTSGEWPLAWSRDLVSEKHGISNAGHEEVLAAFEAKGYSVSVSAPIYNNKRIEIW